MVLNIEARLVCLQKPFLGNKDIAYNTFNFYCPKKARIDTRVLTIIKKKLKNQIILENLTDLIYHLYFMPLDIQDIDKQLNKPIKKTRAINIYKN